MHGGGYYRGSAAATGATVAGVSSASKMRSLSIDDRLAPENPFPAAIDDAYTAYHWLLKQGVDASKIIMGGIPAGGGLAMALLLKLKTLKDSMPAGAVSMSAWTDLTQSGVSMVTKAAEDPVICKAYLDLMAVYYLNELPPKTPLASPLFGDLKGLPLLLVQVGSAETLLDDSGRLADAARKVGVEVEYEIWDDMFHGWHNSAHVLAEGQQAITSIGQFCQRIFSVCEQI